jgi:hypothetical protein
LGQYCCSLTLASGDFFVGVFFVRTIPRVGNPTTLALPQGNEICIGVENYMLLKIDEKGKYYCSEMSVSSSSSTPMINNED